MTKQGALDAFLERMGKIRMKLDALDELADNHFNVDPDDLHWGHVGDVVWLDDQLGEILTRFAK